MFLCGITELFATMEFLQQLRGRASTYSQASVRWGQLFCGQGPGGAVGVFGASALVRAALQTHSGEGLWHMSQPSLQETSWEKGS